MNITLELENNNKLKCRFNGRLDTLNSMEAETSIIKHLERGNIQFIDFDLKDVDYIASYFLRLCSMVIDKINHRENFAILNASPTVYKVFKMAGLCNHLNIKQ